MFLLLYRHTDDGVFDNFLKISDHFPKIYEDSSIIIYHFSYNFSEIIDIFNSEDMENMPLEFRMWLRVNFTSGVFSSKTLVSI